MSERYYEIGLPCNFGFECDRLGCPLVSIAIRKPDDSEVRFYLIERVYIRMRHRCNYINKSVFPLTEFNEHYRRELSLKKPHRDANASNVTASGKYATRLARRINFSSGEQPFAEYFFILRANPFLRTSLFPSIRG